MWAPPNVESHCQLPAISGIGSTAVIERNIVRDTHPVPGGLFGFGIQVQNSGASDSSWEVTLRNNRIYAARFGLFVVSNNARRMPAWSASRSSTEKIATSSSDAVRNGRAR